jgi:uncharacterized protein (TIGR01777 family)
MKIAITGSTGLLGSRLSADLERDGHDVVRLVRPRSRVAGVEWDPAANTIDAAGLAGVEAVVHLAGAGIGDKRWSPQHKRAVLESRTTGTALLARTLAGLDPKPAVLLSGSAIGWYGDRGDEVLTERSAPGTGFLTDVCMAWEAAAEPAVDAGIRTAFLRTGIVLAPKGGVLGKMLPLFKLGLGGRFGSGRQWMSWVSIDDWVGATRFLLDHDVAGPVDLTGPEPVTNAELTKALGAALHRPTFLTVPAFGPRLLLGREMADSLLFISQRVRPAVLEDAGYRFEHPDVASAMAAVLVT